MDVAAPAFLIGRLQILLNTAARVVSGRSRFSPITDYVRDILHWLPAAQRIEFKVATLAFKAQNGLIPSYLCKLAVSTSVASRRPGLRSSSEPRLVVSRHTNKYAERAFAVACPSIWNKLPLNIRTSESLTIFKQRLKTHLFEVAYL